MVGATDIGQRCATFAGLICRAGSRVVTHVVSLVQFGWILTLSTRSYSLPCRVVDRMLAN